MIKTGPLVSIILCTYNGAEFIDEQIESILKQDFIDFELIVLDDCSTDITWELLLKWQENDTRIKLFKNKENIGYNKNFEEAIQLGTGTFIALSDQDDIWLPQKLGKLIAAFASDDIVLTHSRSVRFENGKLNYKLAKLHYHFSGNNTRELLFFNHIMGHDTMFRKSLVKHIVPIPALMSYDWWLAVVATCQGSVAGVDEFLVHHRIHGNNSFFTKGAAIKKKELDLDETLVLFTSIEGMNLISKVYLNKLIGLFSEKKKVSKQTFYPPLFRFLFVNRKIIFGHKKRLFPIFSYLKNAIKYAKMDYEGKGLSF